MCCFAVRSRQKRNHQDIDNRNTYEFNSNAAYHVWNDHRGLNAEPSEHTSSPTTLSNYVRNDSVPACPRRQQSPSIGEVTSDSGFTIQENPAYDH